MEERDVVANVSCRALACFHVEMRASAPDVVSQATPDGFADAAPDGLDLLWNVSICCAVCVLPFAFCFLLFAFVLRLISELISE